MIYEVLRAAGRKALRLIASRRSAERIKKLRVLTILAGSLILLIASRECYSQFDIEKPPFEYSATQDQNVVTELMAQLESGKTVLKSDPDFGYLRSLLSELDVSTYSQCLVFSKTSLQVGYISARNPRAIYFNDDVYVGWVRGSSLLEISTSDPKLGAAFYSAEKEGDGLRIRRRNYTCLSCHATSMTKGIPGHTVRSVYPEHDGGFDFRRKSFITDHKSPLAERWGGWYVTGEHGDMQHMGNSTLVGSRLDTKGNGNLTNLRDRLFTFSWLSSYSDIVSLMVLEHQTQMHNTFTRSDFSVRKALYEHGQKGKDATESDERELKATIEQAATEIVDYMLFLGEAPLTSEIKPSTRFAKVFAERGPVTSDGRSLRSFNLQSRLFEYPCSYLIYSKAFTALTPELRNQVYRQLWSTLNQDENSDKFAHLSNATRTAILEIIRDTKGDLPDYWEAFERGDNDKLP